MAARSRGSRPGDFTGAVPRVRVAAENVEQGVVMATGKKAKNVGHKVKGKAKETTGKAVGNESMEMKGRAEQAKADAKQAGEKGKDTFRH
ncbi:CsbD family protein [Streptomyces sp. NPDC003327]